MSEVQQTSKKNVLVILSTSPYQSSRLRDGMDYCLAAGSFEQNIQLLLLGEASQILLPNQDLPLLQQKNLPKLISAFPLYGIDSIYVDSGAINNFGFKPETSTLGVEVADDTKIKRMIAASDTVLTF